MSDVNKAAAVAGRPIMTEASDAWPIAVGPKDIQKEPMITHSTGAHRSELKPRYDLIPQGPLKRLAGRYEMGLKYGEHNWKKGLPFDDTFNHIIDHLLAYKERRKAFLRDRANQPTESANLMTLQEYVDLNAPDGDDLAAAAWGVFTLMALEKEGRLV